jgi:hypothetical protein
MPLGFMISRAFAWRKTSVPIIRNGSITSAVLGEVQKVSLVSQKQCAATRFFVPRTRVYLLRFSISVTPLLN